MTSFIDTHCHLDMLKIGTAEAVEKAKTNLVEKIITISINEPSFEFIVNAINQYPDVYGTLGIHPHEAKEFNESVLINILQIARNYPKIVAIGETGMDYFYMHSDKEEQQFAFHNQLHLAETLKLPVVLHTRNAEQDTLDILKEHSLTRKGVAHCFTGSLTMAKELINMGWYIGITGIVTFPKSDDLREILHHVPFDRILLETDAPYLTPIPFRGEANDSSKIPVIAKFIANELQIDLEEVAYQTKENSERLFSLNNNSKFQETDSR